MSWRYQATHRTDHGEDVYEVREVFPPDNPTGCLLWTKDAMAPFGETKAELIECLQMMLADVQEFDVLYLDALEP